MILRTRIERTQVKHDHSLHNVRQSGYKCAVARLIGQVDTSSSLVHSGMVRFNFFYVVSLSIKSAVTLKNVIRPLRLATEY